MRAYSFCSYKQKPAYHVLRSDWSSDSCSSELNVKKIKAKITECSLNLQQLNNGYNSNKIIPQSQLYIFSERERLPIMTTYNSKSNISIHTRGKGSLKTSQKMHLLSLLDNTPTMALHSKHITTPENLNTKSAPNFNDNKTRNEIETGGQK